MRPAEDVRSIAEHVPRIGVLEVACCRECDGGQRRGHRQGGIVHAPDDALARELGAMGLL
jgi:hypothetical protein